MARGSAPAEIFTFLAGMGGILGRRGPFAAHEPGHAAVYSRRGTVDPAKRQVHRRGGRDLHEAGFFPWEGPRPTERQVPDLLDRAASGEKIRPIGTNPKSKTRLTGRISRKGTAAKSDLLSRAPMTDAGGLTNVTASELAAAVDLVLNKGYDPWTPLSRSANARRSRVNSSLRHSPPNAPRRETRPMT